MAETGAAGESVSPAEAAAGAASDAPARQLLARLAGVHYIDAGLNCRGAHLTVPDVITRLGRRARPPYVGVHGTPRQWDDPRRRWLREEKDESVALLRAAGLRVTERLYFGEEEPSLAMHFACVGAFELGALVSRLDAAGDHV